MIEETPQEERSMDATERMGKSGSKPGPKHMTFAQKKFVAKITDSDDPETYLKPKGAYRAAYPEAAPSTVANNAYRVLHNPKVESMIEKILEEQGFGVGKRLELIAQIGKGLVTRKYQELTKDGSVVELEEEPTFTERISAIREANKMDGLYLKQRAAADLAREEYRKIAEEMRKDLLKQVREK
jgi:hypothetical protein